MKRWYRHMLWWLISRPIIRAINWEPEDQASFSIFLNSGCGKKFIEFLRQQCALTTFNAVYRDTVSAAVANAHARGMQDALGLILRLGRFPHELESARDDDIEPTQAQKQKMPIDGRAFGMSGNSAIGSD